MDRSTRLRTQDLSELSTIGSLRPTADSLASCTAHEFVRTSDGQKLRNNFVQLLTAKGQAAKDKVRVSKPSGDFHDKHSRTSP